MSIRKTLLMLTINYILIFAWMFWFRMGEMSALIIFPLTMVIAFFDTILAEGRKGAYLWCGNLMIATIAGILLQAYLFARVTGDIQTAMLRAAVEIPVAVILIAIVTVISGHEASKLQKRRRKRILEQQGDPEPSGRPIRDRMESGRRLEDNEGFSFGTGGVMSHRGTAYPDYDPEDDPDDDLEDDPEEERGPKFRVIKK